MYTQRNYKDIADFLKGLRDTYGEEITLDSLYLEFELKFSKDNSKFKAYLFKKAVFN